MKNVEIFNSPMFGELRVSRNDNEELVFCLKDICDALGLEVNNALKRLDPYPYTIGVGVVTGKKADGTDAIQMKNMYFIPEKDLYRCIFQSRKPSARKFQDWVFEEVLPTLRKEGSYSMTQSKQPLASYQIEDPIKRAKRWIEEQQRTRTLEAQTEQQTVVITHQQEQIQKDAPKVEYYDQTLAAVNCITPTQIGNDLGISAKVLNQKLAEIGIIYKQPGQWMFKGKYKEWNLGNSRTFNRILPDGRVIANTNLVWNQRGKRFILALYNNDFNVKDAIAEINGEKRAALESKNNQSNF